MAVSDGLGRRKRGAKGKDTGGATFQAPSTEGNGVMAEQLCRLCVTIGSDLGVSRTVIPNLPRDLPGYRQRAAPRQCDLPVRRCPRIATCCSPILSTKTPPTAPGAVGHRYSHPQPRFAETFTIQYSEPNHSLALQPRILQRMSLPACSTNPI